MPHVHYNIYIVYNNCDSDLTSWCCFVSLTSVIFMRQNSAEDSQVVTSSEDNVRGSSRGSMASDSRIQTSRKVGRMVIIELLLLLSPFDTTSRLLFKFGCII